MTQQAQQWAERMAAWRRSELTQAEFCRRHGLDQGTFSAWKYRLQREEIANRPAHDQRRSKSTDASRPASRKARATSASQSTPPANQFVEMSWPAPAAARGYEVVLASRRVIRLPHDFDPAVVSRLIAAVEAAC